jgi:Cupredoxin-like domain
MRACPEIAKHDLPRIAPQWRPFRQARRADPLYELESADQRGNLHFDAKETQMIRTILAAALAAALTGPALADDATISLALKNHQFVPHEASAPAGKALTIVVSNQDSTPSEFESKTLRVEKVVPGGGTITVRVRALTPGRYRFYDDYHEDTTEGFLVVK